MNVLSARHRQKKIAEEKAKLEKYEATMKQVQERLAALKK